MGRGALDACGPRRTACAELGLEPGDPPELTTLTIAARAGRCRDGRGAAGRQPSRMRSCDGDRLGGFGVPEEERAARPQEAAAAWPLIQADGRQVTFLAYVGRSRLRASAGRSSRRGRRSSSAGRRCRRRAATASTPRSCTRAGRRRWRVASRGSPSAPGRCRRRSSSGSASRRSAGSASFASASNRARTEAGPRAGGVPTTGTSRRAAAARYDPEMATIETNPELGQQIVEDAKRYVLYSWSVQDAINPIAVAGAEGRYFWDYDGKRYLDFASQLVNVSIGYGHPKVVAAIKEQAETLATIGPPMATESRSRLGKLLAEVTPGRPRVLVLHERRHRGQRERDQARPLVHGPPQDHRPLPQLPRRDRGLDHADRRPAPLGRRARHPGRRAHARPVHLPLPGRPSRSRARSAPARRTSRRS